MPVPSGAKIYKITRGLKRYLIDEVMDIYPDLSKKECKKAYKAARKGRA